MGEEPLNVYPWSSYRWYLKGAEQKPRWLAREPVMGSFGLKPGACKTGRSANTGGSPRAIASNRAQLEYGRQIGRRAEKREWPRSNSFCGLFACAPNRSGIQDDLVSSWTGHDFNGFVNLSEGEAVGNDQFGVNQPTLHQHDCFLHRQGSRPETGSHRRFQEMHQTAVQFKLLVSGNAEHIPAGAASQKTHHQLDRVNRPSGLDHQIWSLRQDLI